ncbi:MAG: hypothetical protein KF836_07265 [Fimbriimonadaceae bacterium]|nr:hypothetical protein [Fimbriimonadaceae bacterium]
MGLNELATGKVEIIEGVIFYDDWCGDLRIFEIGLIERIWMFNRDLITIDGIVIELELSVGDPVAMTEDDVGFQEFFKAICDELSISDTVWKRHAYGSFNKERSLFFDRNTLTTIDEVKL